MAARLVVDAILTSAVTFLIDKLSSSLFRRLFQRKKLNRRLIDDLDTTLKAAQAVLNYAETKQIKDEAVKNWLSNLEHAVYVADDLLDEVSTRAEIREVAGNSNDLNFQEEEIVHRMEETIATLESIVKQKKDLGLEAILEAIPEEDKSWRVTTSLLVQTSAIYGRDQDKEAIINLLLDDTRYGELSVIPIVGMGGIGKTTLAQLVFNDERVVRGKFDYTKWVCVGEKLNVYNVSKTILEGITKKPWRLNDLDSLQIELKKELTGKTFLIVLDDVWVVPSDEWNTLLKPFHDGNKGSKIMLTTRDAAVLPTTARTISPYNLSSLSDEHCWLVFLNHSLLSTEKEEYVSLEPIGRGIVKRCNGLPLAAKSLGGLLHSKYDAKDWEAVLKSEIWELSECRIIPALRISYHYLPSHLKRCFVFCSLFPQDYIFDKDELILLWMAENFLQPEGGKTLEEVGCKYFDELVVKSFFQAHTSRGQFVMHDLMHDLATSCAGEFYFRTEELGNGIEIGGKTRHLSCIVKCKEDFFHLTDLCKVEHTRTIITRWNRGELFFDIEDARNMSHLKRLRVLSFNSIPLDTLHPSIGQLIHMRYLDLSYTPIVTLPESLSRLYNLQTLNLRDCWKLKMLPSGMQDLVNLHHLDIGGTPNLEEMPRGMSKMKNLHFLSDYVVGKHEENKIGELGELVNLHGSLCISNIENVGNVNEASEALMSDKKYVNSLCLRWSIYSIEVADSQIEIDILDRLRPHQDLNELSVDGYKGTIFPDWLGNSSYKHMTLLRLRSCENCCTLPSVGQLPSLKHLEISRFDRLVCIGAEFFRGDDSCCETPPFPSLQTLIFHGLKRWEEWRSFEFDDAFPQLKELIITYCPRLKGNLPSNLPKLEKLKIDGTCGEHDCLLPKTPVMLELKIMHINRLRMQELPPSIRSITITGSKLIESVFEAMRRTQPTCLQSLYIEDCDSAISFPRDCVPATLQSLEIWNCKNLDFPAQQQQQHQWLQKLELSSSCDSLTSLHLSAFPNLRDLNIDNCENMESLEVSQPHDASNSTLRSLSISNCPNFVSLSTLWMAAPQLESLTICNCREIESFGDDEGGLPPNLRQLETVGCEKLVSNLASMDLRSHGLTRLYISGANESVKSFPTEGWLPASLEYLHLEHLPSLETLDCNGLSHLTSLHSLFIHYCLKLENMTGQTLPASLTLLHIDRCPLLGERCKVKDPPIWPIISHIKEIEVQGIQIS